MNIPTPWYARLALVLALLLPIYIITAALGTKFALWDWQFGLGTMLFQWGPFVVGGVALVALIALIACVARPPRNGWQSALLALIVPLGVVGAVYALQQQSADIPPIHDVTTNPENPPQFTAGWLQRRANSGEVNPVRAYDEPLNANAMYQSERFAELGAKTLAEVNAESYPDLEPLPLGNNTQEQAREAVLGAMNAMMATETLAFGDTVEGTFSTFWFGFDDDVVVRIGPDAIDFRSVSRVGLSDIGKNASRIRELRAETASRLR